MPTGAGQECHDVAFRWAPAQVSVADSTMVPARLYLGTAYRKGWPLLRWTCCWVNKTSRGQKEKKPVRLKCSATRWACELQGDEILMGDWSPRCAYPFLWTSCTFLMLCLWTGAKVKWVVYVLSQKKTVAKQRTSSPGLRLTVSPNLSSAFSVLCLSQVSSNIMWQMLYSYSHTTPTYGWLAILVWERLGLGGVKRVQWSSFY